MRWAPWRWPHSLSGRMACILIAGLLAAQALTSTIWFDRRHSELIDLPLRVLGVQVADTMKLLEAQPEAERVRTAARIAGPAFQPTVLTAPPADLPPPHQRSQTERLIQNVAQARYGRPLYVWVQEMELLGDKGQTAGTWSMLDARAPSVRYSIVVHVPGRPVWLQVRGVEGENGADTHRLDTIADYFLRIYLVRILIVVLIALFAVRIAMQPLARMTLAAEALGKNINSPPLDTQGPVEVRRAAEAFNRMQSRLVEMLAERSRFLAAVSHDLRSPITRLRLRTEMLADESQREKFRSELADMEAMIDDTLTFMQSGEPEGIRSTVDVNSLVMVLAQNMRETGATVTVTGKAAAPLSCFRLSLQRCIQNIVENAVRYGGRADIAISDSDKALEIIVTDDGPGIPEAEIAQVFEPFYRLEHSRSSVTGGFGLGLSIANAIAAAHGGFVQITNRNEGGIKARIFIPR